MSGGTCQTVANQAKVHQKVLPTALTILALTIQITPMAPTPVASRDLTSAPQRTTMMSYYTTAPAPAPKAAAIVNDKKDSGIFCTGRK